MNGLKNYKPNINQNKMNLTAILNWAKNSILGRVLNTLISKINLKTLATISVILIPIILLWIYLTGIKTPKEIKDALKANKAIELKIDSIKQDNQFLVERMYELEKRQTMFFDQINQNNNLIKENNKELLKLKKIYNEKINSVNGYNVSQLDSFFTNKYKEYYNR